MGMQRSHWPINKSSGAVTLPAVRDIALTTADGLSPVSELDLFSDLLTELYESSSVISSISLFVQSEDKVSRAERRIPSFTEYEPGRQYLTQLYTTDPASLDVNRPGKIIWDQINANTMTVLKPKPKEA